MSFQFPGGHPVPDRPSQLLVFIVEGNLLFKLGPILLVAGKEGHWVTLKGAVGLWPNDCKESREELQEKSTEAPDAFLLTHLAALPLHIPLGG